MGSDFVQRMCPIGLDEHPTICSAGSCDVCIGNRIRWLEEDRRRLARNCQHNLDGKREQEARKKEAISLMHEKDARIAALTKENAQLKSLLAEAHEAVCNWGSYAGEYFQEKWGWQADIAKFEPFREFYPKEEPRSPEETKAMIDEFIARATLKEPT